MSRRPSEEDGTVTQLLSYRRGELESLPDRRSDLWNLYSACVRQTGYWRSALAMAR